MRIFEDFTEEEKEYFSSKLGDIVKGIDIDRIIIEDDNYYELVKMNTYKGDQYLLRMEDDPTIGLVEIGSGRWVPAPDEVYYEITKEAIEEYASTPEEDRYSLFEYTVYNK